MSEDSKKGCFQLIVVPAMVAILAGTTAPWWWPTVEKIVFGDTEPASPTDDSTPSSSTTTQQNETGDNIAVSGNQNDVTINNSPASREIPELDMSLYGLKLPGEYEEFDIQRLASFISSHDKEVVHLEVAFPGERTTATPPGNMNEDRISIRSAFPCDISGHCGGLVLHFRTDENSEFSYHYNHPDYVIKGFWSITVSPYTRDGWMSASLKSVNIADTR